MFVDDVEPAQGRWSEGQSMDGKGEFSMVNAQPMGEESVLGEARPDSGAQSEQM